MRFVFLDHAYPEAWASGPHATMAEWFGHCFGTADFWECELREAGHEAKTLVLNAYRGVDEMLQEAEAFKPDIVVSMEVGRFGPQLLRFKYSRRVAFCSHRADLADLVGWHCVFSSFRWMPEFCAEIGQRCEYLPLAFGRQVLERVGCDGQRDIPVAFIGGLGDRIWKRGTAIMAEIAEAVPEFVWYGYQAGAVPESLQRVHRPAVYGADMYRLLMRTRVCLNRHGEIARGFGNNCRQYEAVGCGSFLLTDDAGELNAPGAPLLGSVYDSAQGAIEKITQFPDLQADSLAAQTYITERHTYRNRLPRFLEVIRSL